jgi:hypothetical protein
MFADYKYVNKKVKMEGVKGNFVAISASTNITKQ